MKQINANELNATIALVIVGCEAESQKMPCGELPVIVLFIIVGDCSVGHNFDNIQHQCCLTV